MPFTEPAFLFWFLPATLAGYFLAPMRLRNLVLTLASFLFYAVGEWAFVGWLLGSTAATYLVARGIDGWRGRPVARWLLVLGLAIDLLLLGWFKYGGFGARTLVWLGLAGLSVPSIALPLGISFFTFHKISYKVDVFRGTAEVRKDPLDLLLYILFFPQLIAGPIVRYHDIAAELLARRVSSADFAEGIRRFAVGFAKKMLVANTVAVVADHMFSLGPERLDAAGAWLGLACYAIQIYFDFSGTRTWPSAWRACSASTSWRTSITRTSRGPSPSSGDGGTSRCPAGSATTSTCRWAGTAARRGAPT